METLDELRSAVHRDPRAVADAAAQFVADARRCGNQVVLSRALSVRGRALRSLGEIADAEADLRAAEAAGHAAGEDDLVADALVGLAGVLSFAGRTAEAVPMLDEAEALGSERVRAYASLQRAIIAQRVGHQLEALASYGAALPTLRRLDARVDIALVLMNRGVVRTQTGDCAGAVADLTEAGELFGGDGNEFGVAQTRHGLGWAHARRGDLPLSLQHLDDATERFRRLGHEALEVDVDRVEVLLAAGLFAAAAELGVTTARRLAAAGNHATAAEMWLLCAQAALLDGDRVGAAQQAEHARALYAAQGSISGELAARLEVARIEVGGAVGAFGPGSNARQDSGAARTAPGADDLASLASALDAVGNARGAAAALSLACLAAATSGDVDRAATLSVECRRRAARMGVFEVRMLAAHASAVTAVAQGNTRAARRQVRAGLADLAQHRSSLAATDARAAVADHAAGLAALGLRIALATGSPADVLAWTERGRADRAASISALPPDDPAAAADLVELRSVVASLRAAGADDDSTADLLQTQRELERSIHARLLRLEGTNSAGASSPPTMGELRAALGGGQSGRALVSLVGIDDRLIAVGVGGARARLADVGSLSAVLGAATAASSILRSLLAPGSSASRRSGLIERLTRALAVIDAAVGGVDHGDGPVVLVVPPALHAVPWQLLPSFAGRPVVIAPSARWWLDAQPAATGVPPADDDRPPPPVADHPRQPALVVAGPRLMEAEREARDVAACYPGAELLMGAAATTGAVLAGMAGASVAHIASHGEIRHDNPLWSSLELADGPLCVYDVERSGRTPPFVVLSGCETGVGVRAGDELLGLSSALLRHGTRRLVASVCLLPDSPATRETMTALHERVAAGVPPSAAIAALAGGALHDESALIAGCLASYGTH